MAVNYGQGIRKRIRGEGYTKDVVEYRLQAALAEISRAEEKGAKAISLGFQDVLPAWIETLKKLGVTVKLNRRTDAADAESLEVGDMDWHLNKVFGPTLDPWFVFEWRLSWDALFDMNDEPVQ